MYYKDATSDEVIDHTVINSSNQFIILVLKFMNHMINRANQFIILVLKFMFIMHRLSFSLKSNTNPKLTSPI